MAQPAPDLIVCGARVHGVEGCDAVAVAGERIVAVGSRAGMLALRAAATRVVDVPRGLVCPGFHDAHGHLVALAEARREFDLHGLGLGAIREAVARAAATRQPGRWIVGRGYDPELFRGATTTARDLLDGATTAHPVLLRSHDYHSVAMSTSALWLTGFGPPRDDAAPGNVQPFDLPPFDVTGGDVERDAHGAPTGILRETAAMAASAQCRDVTPDELARATIGVCFDLARAGITAIHDMSGTRPHDTLRALDETRCLPLDVFATLSPDDVADAAAARPGRDDGARFRVVGMKTFLDGALGSRTAHLLAPYEGETCHCGVEVVARAAVANAAAAGLPSFLHAIGDAAVRAALDVLGEHRGPAARRLRHRVEHAQMIDDADLPRFAAHGIVASLQPVHMALDAPLVHRHWGARSREAFPVRRLLDSGARIAFGSDTPIESYDVLEGIACAVRRVGRDGTPLHPEEAITVAEALDAYTSGAAWAAGAEADLGRIRTGAAGSLTVISEDIVAHPEALGDARIAATVVRGMLVHGATQ